jgi:D-inositol-3-phosphate glycosyltransferase
MSALRVDLVSEHASPLAPLGSPDAGGQNVHVAALAGQLVRLGCEVVVHTRRDDDDLAAIVAAPEGYTVHHVVAGPPTALPKDELFAHMGAFARALRWAWSSQPPDIVHAHFWMSGFAAQRAAEGLGVPFVQTFHALGVVKQRHQGAADTSPPGRLAIEERLAQSADAVIATCRDEVQELGALGAPAHRLHVVPCGVDLDLFTPNGPCRVRRPHLYRLVSLGRLVPRKGVDDVIIALAQLDRAELVVAGGLPGDVVHDPDVARLRALARRCGVESRVHFVGSLSRPAVAALLRSADLAVCAPWYEPFGIVPLEAMACGTPVVGTAVGGLLDTVEDGGTGALVPPHRPDLLARTVRALLADPDRRIVLGQRAVERARRLFGWERVGHATVAVYQQLVGEGAGLRAESA